MCRHNKQATRSVPNTQYSKMDQCQVMTSVFLLSTDFLERDRSCCNYTTYVADLVAAEDELHISVMHHTVVRFQIRCAAAHVNG